MTEPRDPDSQHDDGSLIDEDNERGYVLIPWPVLGAQELSRDASLLYGVLKHYAWQERHCFPGYDRLCADLRAGSRTSVRRWMAELAAVGLVVQIRRGLGKTNVYRLPPIRNAKLTTSAPWSESDHQERQPGRSRSESAQPDGQRVLANTTQRNTTQRGAVPEEDALVLWTATLETLRTEYRVSGPNLAMLRELEVSLDRGALIVRCSAELAGQWRIMLPKAAGRPVRFVSA